jgi:hypothetical protein
MAALPPESWPPPHSWTPIRGRLTVSHCLQADGIHTARTLFSLTRCTAKQHPWGARHVWALGPAPLVQYYCSVLQVLTPSLLPELIQAKLQHRHRYTLMLSHTRGTAHSMHRAASLARSACAGMSTQSRLMGIACVALRQREGRALHVHVCLCVCIHGELRLTSAQHVHTKSAQQHSKPSVCLSVHFMPGIDM